MNAINLPITMLIGSGIMIRQYQIRSGLETRTIGFSYCGTHIVIAKMLQTRIGNVKMWLCCSGKMFIEIKNEIVNSIGFFLFLISWFITQNIGSRTYILPLKNENEKKYRWNECLHEGKWWCINNHDYRRGLQLYFDWPNRSLQLKWIRHSRIWLKVLHRRIIHVFPGDC